MLAAVAGEAKRIHKIREELIRFDSRLNPCFLKNTGVPYSENSCAARLCFTNASPCSSRAQIYKLYL